MNHCVDVGRMNAPIQYMMFYEPTQVMIIITSTMLMSQLEVHPDGKVAPKLKVKLSVGGDRGIIDVIWSGKGLLATAAAENMVRIWDIINDENYTLSLSTPGNPVPRSDCLASIAFNARKRVLAAGTREGRVIMWMFEGSVYGHDSANQLRGEIRTGADSWRPLPPINLTQGIVKLFWGPGERLLAAKLAESVTILNETVLHRKMDNHLAAVQLSSDRLTLERKTQSSITLQTGIRINGIDLTDKYIVLWNGHRAEVYEVFEARAALRSSFDTEATSIAVYEESLFIAVDDKIDVCNLEVCYSFFLSFFFSSLYECSYIPYHNCTRNITNISNFVI